MIEARTRPSWATSWKRIFRHSVTSIPRYDSTQRAGVVETFGAAVAVADVDVAVPENVLALTMRRI